jgi:hypothetical protein
MPYNNEERARILAEARANVAGFQLSEDERRAARMRERERAAEIEREQAAVNEWLVAKSFEGEPEPEPSDATQQWQAWFLAKLAEERAYVDERMHEIMSVTAEAIESIEKALEKFGQDNTRLTNDQFRTLRCDIANLTGEIRHRTTGAVEPPATRTH